MSKRKVTLVLVNDNPHPTVGDTTPVFIELDDLPTGHLEFDAVSIQSPGPGGEMYHEIQPLLKYRSVQKLVGELLTYVEATYTDPEQRKAHKDIVNKLVWDWQHSNDRNARDIVNFAHERRENPKAGTIQ